MEARVRRGRGRGGSYRRRDGDGVSEKATTEEYRGRGRGGFRGRDRRDHHRGRGRRTPDAERNEKDQDDPSNPEEPEDETHTVFSKRKLESNWRRYEAAEESEKSEEQPVQRGTDYHVLLGSAGDSFTQFRFAEEKDWETDSLADNRMCTLFMDIQDLAESLQLLPLCQKLNLEPELIQVTTPVELPMMSLKVKQEACVTGQLKAAGTVHCGSAGSPAAVTLAESVSRKAEEVPLHASNGPEDVHEELDFLLSLQNTAANMNQAQAVLKQTVDIPELPLLEDTVVEPEQTEEDLEDWLDSMIS